jgi:hypothetical protein
MLMYAKVIYSESECFKRKLIFSHRNISFILVPFFMPDNVRYYGLLSNLATKAKIINFRARHLYYSIGFRIFAK